MAKLTSEEIRRRFEALPDADDSPAPTTERAIAKKHDAGEDWITPPCSTCGHTWTAHEAGPLHGGECRVSGAVTNCRCEGYTTKQGY